MEEKPNQVNTGNPVDEHIIAEQFTGKRAMAGLYEDY